MIRQQQMYNLLKKVPTIENVYEEGATPHDGSMIPPYLLYRVQGVSTDHANNKTYSADVEYKVTVVSTQVTPEAFEYIVMELNGRLETMFIYEGLRNMVFTVYDMGVDPEDILSEEDNK